MAVIYILAPFDPIPGEAGYPGRFGCLKEKLEEAGHEVHWWTSDWEHAGKCRRNKPSLDSGIHLLSAPEYHKNVSLARLRNHKALARKYVKDVSAEIQNGYLNPPDLQLYAMPPLGTARACRKIKTIFGGKLVLDIMDVWPDTFFQLIPFASSKLKRVIGSLLFYPFVRQARPAISQCDALSAQSHSFIEWARNRGFKDRPSHVCYLGADLPRYAKPRSYGSGEPLRLAYMGAMGMSYDLETVIQAVHQLLNEGNSISLDVAGGGRKEEWIRSYVATNGLGNSVESHGYLPKEKVFEMLSTCHLGLVPLFPDSGVAVPYKACEYASQGLGMIHSLPGELEQLVSAFNAGNSYEAGSIDSLVSVLRDYFINPGKVEEHSEGAAKLAHAHFDRSTTYKAFAHFLSGLLPGKA